MPGTLFCSYHYWLFVSQFYTFYTFFVYLYNVYIYIFFCSFIFFFLFSFKYIFIMYLFNFILTSIHVWLQWGTCIWHYIGDEQLTKMNIADHKALKCLIWFNWEQIFDDNPRMKMPKYVVTAKTLLDKSPIDYRSL